MTKIRQDAWTKEDDLLLAETVLRHIREGSTQLKAFEEVGDLLNRTSAACGFRWNAEVRQKYKEAIELAKKQRKQLKREKEKKIVAIDKENNFSRNQSIINLDENEKYQKQTESSIDTIKNIIEDLKHWVKSNETQLNKNETYQNIINENRSLKKEIHTLQLQLQTMSETLSKMKENYSVFMDIFKQVKNISTQMPNQPTTNNIIEEENLEESLQQFINHHDEI